MNINKLKDIRNLSQLKNMIECSDWIIYQVIKNSGIIMLSPDNRYYLSITTDLLNSHCNSLQLTDRILDRTTRNKDRIRNNGHKELYQFVNFLK